MHADEVRDAQITGHGASAQQGQTGPAVRDSDGVCSGDALKAVELGRDRRGHQEGQAHSAHGVERAGPNGEGPGRVTEIGAEEQEREGQSARIDEESDRADHDKARHGQGHSE